MPADQRLRAAAAEQHHGSAVHLRLQSFQKCLHLEGAAERTEHDQIGMEIAQHGPDIGGAGFARDEAEFVKHVGEKHSHVGSVLDDACARRNRPPPELDDLAAPLAAVVARHGPVLTNSQSQIARRKCHPSAARAIRKIAQSSERFLPRLTGGSR